MKVLEAISLGSIVESMCLEISTKLPEDVTGALIDFQTREESELGRRVIDMILENAGLAASGGLPICQDTGVFTIYLDLGLDTALSGDFTSEAASAVSRATKAAHLRPSIVGKPAGERLNTGDNTPPLVKIGLSRDSNSHLSVIAKGGGSENASRLSMLAPGAGWEGIKDFVIGVVDELGSKACPPLVLGIGVGGSFDTAPELAKKALLHPLNVKNPDSEAARIEEEIVEAVNGLGIGPGGLGGTVTCIGTRILQMPCHMANLPVAVSLNCHALRRKTVLV